MRGDKLSNQRSTGVKGTVVLVRHRIHSGGFRAYALNFVSVFGSANAGIHRDKEAVDLMGSDPFITAIEAKIQRFWLRLP